MSQNYNEYLDLVGVGAGPSNLSLAALLSKNLSLKMCFLEKQSAYQWHGGMLLPESYLQINVLKDLVTPIDPTNKFSFLNYLVQTGRFYSFVTADFPRVHRRDYSAYLDWVGTELSTVVRGEEVNQISYDGCFKIRTSKRHLDTKSISVAVGQVPNIPLCIRDNSPGRIVHSSVLMWEKIESRSDSNIVIVGGGQSGAEIFLHYLREPEKWGRITWVSRRTGFPSLEESHFTNEFFTPAHTRYFRVLPESIRSRQTKQQKLANDGVSKDTIASIYQELYKLRYCGGQKPVVILDATELIKAESSKDRVDISFRSLRNGDISETVANTLILCTGYRNEFPGVLRDICSGRINPESYELDEHFRLQWDAPDCASIYLMNAGIRSYGIADSNLSIMAWRAATIANHIVGSPIYNTDHDPTMLDFHSVVASANLSRIAVWQEG